jgi:hypothetical protein
MWRRVSPGLSSLEPLRHISSEELDEQLAGCPQIEALLGGHYRHLAGFGQLTDDLLPGDWRATQAELAAIVGKVSGFSVHQPIKTGRPRSDIYATLAEIEGFAWLLEQGYDSVEALPYRTIRGGTAPDARCYRGGDVSLYEVKSFMAYWERRRFPLKTFGPNTLVFGARPVGRYIRDAERRRGAPLERGEYNTLLVDLTVERLLDKARRQLTKYAEGHGINHCPRGILLVMTRYGSPPPLIREALRAAKAWHARHADITIVTPLPEDVCQALAAGI